MCRDGIDMLQNDGISLDVAAVAFPFFFSFPFLFLDENQDILGVGCLDKRDSSVQLDQILHCLYSYSKAG